VKSHRGALILLTALGLAVLGLGYLGWRAYQRHVLPDRENVSVEEKHRQTKDAFAGAEPASEGEARELSAALDQFNLASTQQNFAAISATFDSARLCDELDRLGVFDSLNSSQKNSFKAGFAASVPRGVFGQSTNLIWSSHKVKRIVLSENRREAVVYDMEAHGIPPKRYFVKVRWWLNKSGVNWKIWDFEVLGEGMRLSTIAAAMIPSSGLNGTAMSSNVTNGQQLIAAAASLKKGDWAGFETGLKALNGQPMMPIMLALQQLFWARLHVHQSDYPAVLKDCQAIESTGLDFPFVYEFYAIAYNKLGQYDKALESALKWENALGGESELYYQMGIALSHLKRNDEAAQAFEKSLDEDPEAAVSLVELSKLLPAGNKSKIADRFALSQSPATVFSNAAPILQRNRDLEGMQILIDAYRARTESANDPMLTYYDSELRILRKQYKEAEAQLKTILPSSTRPGLDMIAREYVYAALLAGDAMEGYSNAPDPQAAFKVLASRLLATRNNPTLEQLVTLHLSRFPRDSWAYYYQGRLQQATRNFPAADSAFASAVSLADAKDQDTFRAARVDARFRSGDGLAAYHDIAPQDKVFVQLARLFSNARQIDNLNRLVAARQTDAPDDPNLPLWNADAKYLAHNYADCITILSDQRDVIRSEKTNQYMWRDLYIRSQVRLGQFDAARAENKRSQGDATDWWHTAIVECAAGNVPDGEQALDTLLTTEEFSAAQLYDDTDLGPAIARPAFASWRSKNPRPVTRPSTRATTTPARS
jgi:tetratricopeptide (TPR) repeat protein